MLCATFDSYHTPTHCKYLVHIPSTKLGPPLLIPYQFIWDHFYFIIILLYTIRTTLNRLNLYNFYTLSYPLYHYTRVLSLLCLSLSCNSILQFIHCYTCIVLVSTDIPMHPEPTILIFASLSFMFTSTEKYSFSNCFQFFVHS